MNSSSLTKLDLDSWSDSFHEFQVISCSDCDKRVPSTNHGYANAPCGWLEHARVETAAPIRTRGILSRVASPKGAGPLEASQNSPTEWNCHNCCSGVNPPNEQFEWTGECGVCIKDTSVLPTLRWATLDKHHIEDLIRVEVTRKVSEWNTCFRVRLRSTWLLLVNESFQEDQALLLDNICTNTWTKIAEVLPRWILSQLFAFIFCGFCNGRCLEWELPKQSLQLLIQSKRFHPLRIHRISHEYHNT